nr:PREDICTED: calmin isoform X1 [Lepisosteus oculatus]
MAGHEWDDWFEREELIGQISDIRVQNLQVEREVVQKRTFTRWMNLHLEKCKPPLEVSDLFTDIQDGRILMALLEELSGCKLLHGFKPSTHRIFRLNNIAKVLTFLEERNVKLVSIDAADIADGNSSIVLGLIWNIILFFQIKELTGNIKNRFPSSSSLSSLPNSTDSDTSHPSTPCEEQRLPKTPKDHGRAIKTLLHWVQRRTRKYGVAVQDFGKSWTSGLAFLAIIKAIDPSLVDMRRALEKSQRQNVEDAFRIAHYSLGIPRLLDPEDVTVNSPDEQSIMTYVSQFLEHFPEHEDEEVSELVEISVSAATDSSVLKEERINGVKSGKRSCVARTDWVQLPPKIFISSASDDPEHTSPDRGGHCQPWAHGDDSSESTSSSAVSAGNGKLPLELCSEMSFLVSSSSSPQPSFVDSVLDSPDSLSEIASESMPLDGEGQSSDSRSSSSLNESDPPFDPNGKCSPEKSIKTVKKDYIQGTETPLEDNAAEDNIFSDLFIDEGTFSQSSVDSFHMKSKLLSEEEDAYRYILDLNDAENASQSECCSGQEEISTPSEAQDRLETALKQNCLLHHSLEEIVPSFMASSSADLCGNTVPSEQDKERNQEGLKLDACTRPETQCTTQLLCINEPGEMNGSVVYNARQNSILPVDMVYYPCYEEAVSNVSGAFSKPVTERKQLLSGPSLGSDSAPAQSDHHRNTEACTGNHPDMLETELHADLEHLNRVTERSCHGSMSAQQDRGTEDHYEYVVSTDGEVSTDRLSDSIRDCLAEQSQGSSQYQDAGEQIENKMPGGVDCDKKEQQKEDFWDLEDVESDVSEISCEFITATKGHTAAGESTDLPSTAAPCDDSLRESHLSHMLYLRKLDDSEDIKETSMKIKAKGCETIQTVSSDTREEYSGSESSPETPVSSSEDCMQLLLFLWILLYCLFLIPQLDLEALPHALLALKK